MSISRHYQKILSRVELPKEVIDSIRNDWEKKEEYSKDLSAEQGIWKLAKETLLLILTFGIPLALILATLNSSNAFKLFANLSIAFTWVLILSSILLYGFALALAGLGVQAIEDTDGKEKSRELIFHPIVLRTAVFKEHTYHKFLSWFSRISIPIALAMYGAIFTTVSYIILLIAWVFAKAVTKQLVKKYIEQMSQT